MDAAQVGCIIDPGACLDDLSCEELTYAELREEVSARRVGVLHQARPVNDILQRGEREPRLVVELEELAYRGLGGPLGFDGCQPVFPQQLCNVPPATPGGFVTAAVVIITIALGFIDELRAIPDAQVVFRIICGLVDLRSSTEAKVSRGII